MILLTGATGLVGSHMLLRLLQEDRQVRALKREGSHTGMLRQVFHHYTDDPEALISKVEWYDADILDIPSLEGAFEGVDTVIHCAAVVSFARKDREMLYRVNVKGTANLVNLAIAHDTGTFVYISSVASIGRSKEGPANEDTEWDNSNGLTHYSNSKHEAEMEVWRGAEEGLNVVIVNPSTIIGPGEWGRGSTAIVYRLWKGLRTYTEGVNGFVDVRDVIDATMMLIDKGIRNERFLLSAVNLSFRDLFTAINGSLGLRTPGLKVSRLLAALTWRLEAARCLITGATPMITRETARKAFEVTYYDGSRITRNTGFSYRPIDDTIGHTCGCLLRDLGPSSS